VGAEILSTAQVARRGRVFGTHSHRFGRTHGRRYTTRMRDLVVAVRACPGRIVIHRGRLEDAPGLYQRLDQRLDQRADGVIEAVLRPK